MQKQQNETPKPRRRLQPFEIEKILHEVYPKIKNTTRSNLPPGADVDAQRHPEEQNLFPEEYPRRKRA